jgi:CBS-domain-containing membrane protein
LLRIDGLNVSSHKEKILSGLGGAVSIVIVFWITQLFEQGMHAHLLLVASMGATAVLLFAAPNSPLSQPWNVIAGHMVSALIGIFVLHVLKDPVLGGALSVGLAITAMYYLQCLHPPGGATSLIPLISAPLMDSYGFMFVLFPVGLGAILMVLIAIAFNYPLKWRRYPLALAERTGKPVGDYPDITHADFVAALAEIDTYVDISEQDILRIYQIASGRPHPHVTPVNGEKD